MRLRTKRRIAWLVLFSLEMGLVLLSLYCIGKVYE